MNILVINQPLRNRGDESAHRALIRTLINRFPDVCIRVLFVGCKDSDIKEFIVNDCRVHYINLKRCKLFGKIGEIGIKYNSKFLWYFHPTFRCAFTYYYDSDVILCAPGGIDLGPFQSWNHLLMLQIAKYLRKPLVYYGRSFGPFPEDTKKNIIFRKYAVEVLNYMRFVSIRDRQTEKIANELGLSYVSTVDSAFLECPKVKIPKIIQDVIAGSPYMVFVPNLLIWHFLFKNRLKKSEVLDFYLRVLDIVFIHNPDYKVVMLPQTYGYGEKNDYNFFLEISRLKNDSRIIVLDDCYSSDIQQTLIADSKYVIGARYHSVVFALNQSVPFIALSYEHKICGLLQSLDKELTMIDLTRSLFEVNGIYNTLKKIDEMLFLIKPDFIAQKKAKQIANKCMNNFVTFLNRK